jgi:DNA segregation ATPase FtsK/SpoIIIE-like protein
MATRPSPRSGTRSRSTSSRARTTSSANSRSNRSGARSRVGARTFFSHHLGRQADDLWGLILVVTGVLCGLGIWFDMTGPFGRFMKNLTGSLVGQAKIGMPIMLIAVGWVLIRGTGYREPVRHVIGWVFVGLAACGVMHISEGSPSVSEGSSVLRQAGGYLGAVLGGPTQRLLGKWGAAIVLGTLMFLGALIIMRLRIRDFVNQSADTARPVGALARRGLTSLFTLGPDDTEIIEPVSSSRKSSKVDRPQVRLGVNLRKGDTEADDGRDSAQDRVTRGRVGVLSRPIDDDGDPSESIDLTDRASDDKRSAQRASRSEGPVKLGLGGNRSGGSGDGEGNNSENTGLEIDLTDPNHSSSALFDGAGAFNEDSDPTDPALGSADSRKAKKERKPLWKEPQETTTAALPGLQGRVEETIWKLPSPTLLKKGKKVEIDRRAVESMGRVLEEALASHGVETRLVGMTVGPTVTRYELELGPGVKVAKVTALHKDIAYAMATADVRILAPIPGKSAIGVEVPNRQRQLVAVADVLFSDEAKRMDAALGVAIGRDIDGKAVMVDLAKMPHVLVAGTTGSGKSSCINSLLTSILMRATPDQVRMILIDPKMVELSQYNGLPHLLTQVVTNPKKAANALQWAVEEMERRYELLAMLRFRDIGGYNAAIDSGALDDPYADDPAKGLGAPPAPKYERLSQILVVIDELADLMMVAGKEVEDSIVRIAQKARAVGIHLVIATQRPSVNVITGLIKANVPSRFAFAVSSLTDSRVILDQPGAERLIGQGDMLMVTVSSNVPTRVQGNFVSEEEIRKIVDFWTRQTPVRSGTSGLPAAGLDDPSNDRSVKEHETGFVGFSDIPTDVPDVPRGGVPAFHTAAFPTAGGRDANGQLVGQLPIPGTSSTGIGGLNSSGAATSIGGGIGFGGNGELVPNRPPEEDNGDSDEFFDAAMELVVRSQLGSTSMLQRKLRVGFSRAGRLMDLLENQGIVGPSTGGKARDVKMSVEELNAYQNRKRGNESSGL